MRPIIQFIKDNFTDRLTGCEIGVYKGDNALEMLRNIPIKKLYLIDPYTTYPEYKDICWNLKSQADFDTYWNIAHEKLRGYSVEFIREKSQDIIINEPLDFVYIDGNHSYEYAKSDVEKYYKSLKIGGILSGDNYNQDYQGVINAVDELCIIKQLTLHLKFYNLARDWWVIKEQNE
jgi:predicted O-methyltransferase YrrM